MTKPTDEQWYLIITTPTDGRHLYPVDYNGDPADTDRHVLVDQQVAAVFAAHGVPADYNDRPGWDTMLTCGEPHPTLQLTRHDRPEV